MAKKDTYLALLRRGIDETTAQVLADGGIKIGDLKKLVMNRLGKTIELIVKLENNLDDESKDEQKSKLRDQLETRGLEAARDHEMLELDGTPQDIVDFRRKIAPVLCLHACPHCGEEMDPRGSNIMESPSDFSFICWDCEEEFHAPMAQSVESRLNNGSRISIDPNIKPRLPVVRAPLRDQSSSITDLMMRDLESAGASAEELEAALESSTLSGVLMSIDEWIDQTIAAKGYIQAQEARGQGGVHHRNRCGGYEVQQVDEEGRIAIQQADWQMDEMGGPVNSGWQMHPTS